MLSREQRYTIELTEALRVMNLMRREVWSIKRTRMKAGTFPLVVDEAGELVTGIGYREDGKDWYRMVAKLTRLSVGELRREHGQFDPEDDPGGDDDDGLNLEFDVDEILHGAGL